MHQGDPANRKSATEPNRSCVAPRGARSPRKRPGDTCRRELLRLTQGRSGRLPSAGAPRTLSTIPCPPLGASAHALPSTPIFPTVVRRRPWPPIGRYSAARPPFHGAGCIPHSGLGDLACDAGGVTIWWPEAGVTELSSPLALTPANPTGCTPPLKHGTA
jgi:hypothetical protein